MHTPHTTRLTSRPTSPDSPSFSATTAVAYVWGLAVAGELWLASAGLVREAVTMALVDSGRVLVDLSGLR